MTARRPMCATCFSQPREEGSARCSDCGPGRIKPATPVPSHRPTTPFGRLAEYLGDTDTDTTNPEPTEGQTR